MSSRPDRVGAERRPDEPSNEALLRGPGFCCRANVRRFQGDVPAGSAEEVSQKRGLPGRTRAGEHHGRKFGGSSHQHRLQGTLDVTFVHQPIDMEIMHLECMISIFELSSMMCTPIPADPWVVRSIGPARFARRPRPGLDPSVPGTGFEAGRWTRNHGFRELEAMRADRAPECRRRLPPNVPLANQGATGIDLHRPAGWCYRGPARLFDDRRPLDSPARR